MHVFLHDRLRRLSLLIDRANAVLARFNSGDLGLAEALTDLLDEAIASYHALGRSREENELLVWKAQWTSARQGVDPLRHERVIGHRRALERAIALHVLQSSARRLRDDAARDEAALSEAQTQLQPIVLLALQRSLLTPAEIAANGPQLPGRLWRSVLDDMDLSPAARQVAMRIHLADIELLLAELLATLATPPAAAPPVHPRPVAPRPGQRRLSARGTSPKTEPAP